ncbi:tetratricopeptide repeat protein [Actinoplanes hulinensis]|uniref:Tetratricopeptide repeat protein n=1 Tax=Actinoplanes hulinensis TaxID=1144547 RepID=A0ABS7B7D0_9ACTN|nr:tetratricopeptide repeat protein [Actinoplanes hulinensis]MBW6436890.1 tetratricopeptide repeat protein [Actinoplanes hulinensis]
MVTGLVLDAAGFEVLVAGQRVGTPRSLEDFDVELLRDVTGRYVDAIHTQADDAVFLGLGRELFAWLDGDLRQLTLLLDRAATPLMFEIQGPRAPSAAGWAVLRAPWEVLADQGGFLAADALRRFEVVRRLGKPSAAPPLDRFRLGLMFMASAPAGQHELDFEAEESAILTAVGDRQVDLVVEDTGDPDQLRLRWADLDGLPVLHLSCHGVNNWPASAGGPRVPVLMMENEVGDGRPVTAAELVKQLSVMPRLMFVSACLTATPADATGYLAPGPDHRSTDTEAGADVVVPVAHSLSTELVTAGIPAVVGWDGSVTDGAATLFAQHLYQQLGSRQDLVLAVGDARRKLLACDQPPLRADWHLARIWLGPAGGGPVVAGASKRQKVSAIHGTKTFLDLKRQHVPVASADMFVGRRREMRQALRVLRGGEQAGVLLNGQGRLGKSSLAARLADRFPDRAVAVLFGDYTALGVLDAITTAVQDNPAARAMIEARRAEVRDRPEALRWVLVDLLAGPCTQNGDDHQRPLLLIIDDLEQVLEPRPEGPHRVSAGFAPVLAAVLQAFDPDRSDSRLVVTSRFVFALDGLEDRLTPVQLAPLSDVAQRKLAVRQRAVSPEELREARAGLAARAMALSGGNPGLQDLVGLRLVYSSEVTPARAEQAVTDMETYLDQGDLPTDGEVRAFVENLALDALIGQAGPDHVALLRALSLFDLPMPPAVTVLLETRTGGTVQRLCGLGLADTFPDPHSQAATAVAVNALAAGRLTPLTEPEQVELATAAVQPLAAAWTGPKEQSPWDPALDLQLTRLAVLADDPAVTTRYAAGAVWTLGSGPAAQALALGQAAISVLDRHGSPAPALLLRQVADAAQVSGDGDTAAALFDRAVKQATMEGATADPLEHARVIAEYARLLITRGELDRAEQLLSQARDMFTTAHSDRETAITWGNIADILFRRGEYDEALRIRHERELPVYQHLGDTRSTAITWGDISNILYQRGEYDEALRIHHDQLPVYERLGDTRSTATTWGKIADILYEHGEYDEALRIRHERELPVYQHLGDTRSTAITWGDIADILYQRGEYDKALRIHHDQLPVYKRLGDTRSTATTWGKIADILHQRGEQDEALRIRQEKVLPAFERLDDLDGIANATWGIAEIQLDRREFEAAAPNVVKAFQILEHLQRPDGLAIVGNTLGQMLIANGETDTARQVLETSRAAARKIAATALEQHLGELLRKLGQNPEEE